MRPPAWPAGLALCLALAGAPEAGGQSATCHAGSAWAEPFAPILADSGRLFRLTVSADRGTIYYFKKVTPDQEDYRIFRSQFHGGSWTEGVRVDLGGEYSDLYPTLSPDGQRLVFASYRPAPGDPSATPNAYLWYADRQGDGWGEPVFIAAATRFGNYHSGPVINARYGISFHRISADWRETTAEAVQWDGTGYVRAAPAADAEERWSDWRPGEAHIWGVQASPSGRFAVLEVSSIQPDTKRRAPPDLWITEWKDGGWTSPRRAEGGVNTEVTENFVAFAPDGCDLYFTRGFSRFFRVPVGAALTSLGAERR